MFCDLASCHKIVVKSKNCLKIDITLISPDINTFHR